MRCVLIFLACLWVPVILALPRRYQGRLVYDEEEKHGAAHDRSGMYFTQVLDHFDRTNTDTFQQRYFVNATWWQGADSGAPVFMCVGGEGPPLDAGVVQIGGSVHCDDMMVLASQVGALTVALEHRFYGPSTPSNDAGKWSVENMRVLNTEQALEDVAGFIAMISDKYGLYPSSGAAEEKKNKWVTWGGSYPGMVAALSRLRYPHLIHASVSSSSPLEASLEMPGYNQVVGESIGNPDVGGSPQCFATVRDGHAAIKALLGTEDGRRYLETEFNICDPNSLDTRENQESWAGDGVVYLPAQGNDPACTGQLCNIQGICAFLLEDHDDSEDGGVSPAADRNVLRLASLSRRQHFGQCVPVASGGEAKYYSEPNNPSRAWLWQTCTC